MHDDVVNEQQNKIEKIEKKEKLKKWNLLKTRET